MWEFAADALPTQTEMIRLKNRSAWLPVKTGVAPITVQRSSLSLESGFGKFFEGVGGHRHFPGYDVIVG